MSSTAPYKSHRASTLSALLLSGNEGDAVMPSQTISEFLADFPWLFRCLIHVIRGPFQSSRVFRYVWTVFLWIALFVIAIFAILFALEPETAGSSSSRAAQTCLSILVLISYFMNLYFSSNFFEYVPQTELFFVATPSQFLQSIERAYVRRMSRWFFVVFCSAVIVSTTFYVYVLTRSIDQTSTILFSILMPLRWFVSFGSFFVSSALYMRTCYRIRLQIECAMGEISTDLRYLRNLVLLVRRCGPILSVSIMANLGLGLASALFLSLTILFSRQANILSPGNLLFYVLVVNSISIFMMLFCGLVQVHAAAQIHLAGDLLRMRIMETFATLDDPTVLRHVVTFSQSALSDGLTMKHYGFSMENSVITQAVSFMFTVASVAISASIL